MIRPKSDFQPCVLGIDCDGVLSDFNKSLLRFIHRETDVLYDANDIKQWDVLINFGLEHLEPKLDHEIEFNKFCLNLEPFEGVGGALFDLKVLCDAEIHCVTAPYHVWTWPGERIKWLQAHFGFMKREIHLTHAKHMMEFDVFIDDSLKSCFKYATHRPNSQVFLWEQTYNEIDGPAPGNLIRTNDWSKVVDYVHDFNHRRMQK